LFDFIFYLLIFSISFMWVYVGGVKWTSISLLEKGKSSLVTKVLIIFRVTAPPINNGSNDNQPGYSKHSPQPLLTGFSFTAWYTIFLANRNIILFSSHLQREGFITTDIASVSSLTHFYKHDIEQGRQKQSGKSNEELDLPFVPLLFYGFGSQILL